MLEVVQDERLPKRLNDPPDYEIVLSICTYGCVKKLFFYFDITSRRFPCAFHAEQRGVSRFPEKRRFRLAQITFRILKMHGRSKNQSF